MKHDEMSVMEHITELRKRLVIVVVFFFVAVIAGFLLSRPIIIYLQQTDEAKSLTLNAFNLTDPLMVYMKFAFIINWIVVGHT